VTDLRALRASYDDLAADYERIFPDWPASSRRQGAALDRLIAAELSDRLGPAPRRILDCAAGIGTQALALAELGHHVVASDVSEVALRRLVEGERARSLGDPRAGGTALGLEGTRPGSLAGAIVADMRRLPFAEAAFEVVVCADNSLPHLLSAADVVAALREMRRVCVPGGLVLVSTRDYDELRRTRPGATPVQVSRDQAGLAATFQVWTWHDDGERYDYDHLMLSGDPTDDGTGWRVGHRTGTYWALTRAQLSSLAGEAGLAGVRWLVSQESGFFQPLMLART
jgi:SAM-dependent methyltransferase